MSAINQNEKSQSPIILALDTATEACSAAVITPTNRFHEFDVCPQQHSQKALPMVQSVLSKAELQISDIDYLVFGQGPGSFTGVRIACGMIQGLALGTQKPALGISTLAAMAWQATGKKIAVAIDARMGEVYFAAFEKTDSSLIVSHEERVISPAMAAEIATEFQPDSIAGTGWQAYPELSAAIQGKVADVLYPSALAMAELANIDVNLYGNKGTPANKIEPVYLRDKVTWKKLPGKG